MMLNITREMVDAYVKENDNDFLHIAWDIANVEKWLGIDIVQYINNWVAERFEDDSKGVKQMLFDFFMGNSFYNLTEKAYVEETKLYMESLLESPF